MEWSRPRARLDAGGRKTVYLGPYDSDESRQNYARLIAELAATPVPSVPPTPGTRDGHVVTVNDLLLAFWMHAERHYRRADGTVTNELAQYRQTFRLVKELYGRTPAVRVGSSNRRFANRISPIGRSDAKSYFRIGRIFG